MNNLPILVNGSLIDSSEKIYIKSPITNSDYASVPYFDPKFIVNNAMNAAHNAFIEWSKTTFEYRKKLLLQFKQLVLDNLDHLTDIIVNEIAKSKKDSQNEIIRTMEYLDKTINEYEHLLNNPLIIDEKIHHVKNKVGKFILEPLGVVLAIAPFNYPFNLLLTKIIPALISGNTVVYKPAINGSAIGAEISKLFLMAKFPSGVVNCVVGYGNEVGDLLVTHKYVNMISFTGSSEVGNHIFKICNKIPLVLELGGMDPAIVCDDANIELAADEIVKGSLLFNGQRCTATKRIFVHKSIHTKLVNIIKSKIVKLSVGSPLDNCFITPLINNEKADYIIELANEAILKGANSILKIQRQNNLVWPILLDNVTIDMKVVNTEPFGPILPIIEFENINDAIKYANISEYGLQASVFTSNIDLANNIASQLECGTVNINKSSSRSPDEFPFMGIKNSGLGTQGVKYAILSMTKLKGIIYNN